MSLRDALQTFTPYLIEFLDLKSREWRTVESNLAKRNTALEMQQATKNEPVTAKTTIYDLLVEAHLGNTTAARFLSFIDSIAVGLARVIPEHLKPSARLQARNLFMNFSHTSSKYLDTVGELAAILYILEKTSAVPIGFEEKRLSGKNTTLDLSIKFDGGGCIAVEVLNIWINDSKITDESGLHAVLDYRIRKKIQEKTGESLPATQLPFPLLMVLWFQNVQTVCQFSKAIIGRAKGNELPACVILQYRDEENQKNWIFSSLAELATKGQFNE